MSYSSKYIHSIEIVGVDTAKTEVAYITSKMLNIWKLVAKKKKVEIKD